MLVEAIILEKFGWTPEQLDEQDTGRVMRAMAALSIRDEMVEDARKKEAAKSTHRKR